MAGAEFAADGLENRAATQGRRPRHAVRDVHKTWAAQRAIAAWRRSAALGSGAALEVLARLYRDRGEWLLSAEALEWAFFA
jgi:hypothetical protein